MVPDLGSLVADVARSMVAVDARRPIAINQRLKQAFQPGIGPHSESATVGLLIEELAAGVPERYGAYALSVPYPQAPRQKCDLCLGAAPDWEWSLEVKLLRFFGDNGQPNDNMLMHTPSAYAEQRSALTDCTKLVASGLRGRKAILIYGFESEAWPLAPAIDAFETLARARGPIGERLSAAFEGLVHPVHARGAVHAWELLPGR